MFLLGIAISLIVFLGFLISSDAKNTFTKGINQGRIEVFTGQVICRQIPLHGTEIELECVTRKEVEDLLKFIQPQGETK